MGVTRRVPIYPTPASLPRNRKSRQVSLLPPIGGWNTRDDPAQMPSTDATHLVNMWPDSNEVTVRRGYIEHATGVGAGNVDTVAEFSDGADVQLITASASNIYNATSAGAASSLGSGFTSGRWQTAMMNGVMGLVNGADAPQDYDGATLAGMTISGVGTASDLIGIHVFKSRSYFWKADSPSFWYSATNALGGACTEFQLGEIARLGGHLLSMQSWSVDGGDGVDDFAVFLMSSGEVLVYQGSDPGSSSDWALVGSYRIPTPLSIRSATKIGAQIVVLTDNDMVFLPSAFDQPSPPESKLSGAIEIAGPTYRANTGWETVYFPKRNMLIMNVPISSTQFEQYVMNSQTGAPARFINQNARAFGVVDNELYFGTTNGRVMQADTGSNDDGSNMDADARQGWSDLGLPSNKKVEAYRFVMSGTSSFEAGGAIAYDHTNKTVSRRVTTGGSGLPWGSPWGSAWGSGTSIKQNWRLDSGFGQVVSPQLSIGVEGERPAWYRTDLLISQAPNL